MNGAQWDPWAGPYAGIVGPQVALRVSWKRTTDATWIAAFTGAVAADGWNYIPGTRARTEVSATDATQALAAFDPPERSPIGTGDTAAERVNRILDVASWPANLRDVSPGGVKLKSSTMANALWTQLLAVADTDLALLWFRRDGRLSYRPEGRVGVGVQLAAALVICADPGQPNAIQVVTIGGAQFADIRNIVAISRQKEDGVSTEPATATVRDDGSIARYLSRGYSRTDLQHQDDAWSTTIAQTVLQASAWPSRAPREAALSSQLGDPDVPPLLLSLEPDMTFDVQDTSGTHWREACVGWNVTVGRHRIDGTIVLSDVTKWIAAKWDTSVWDLDRWSFAVTVPAALDERN
jgi:hypothetical protein